MINIKKYLSGRSSDKEQKELLDWIRKEDHLSEFQSVKKEWERDVVQEELDGEYQPYWMAFQQKLYRRSQGELLSLRRTLKYFRYAAIFLLLLMIPSLLYLLRSKPAVEGQPLVYTSIMADLGQISKVVLPDSTVVWINSGSTLTYNNQFSSTNRDISLTGEAFFKVTTNTRLPLVVKCNDLRVKVLGTRFCVSAYPEEKNIQVVLEKGKVELFSDQDFFARQEMAPGELASYTKDENRMTLSHVNTRLYTSWKDGLINIYNLPLSDLILKLEKRYNQKFIVDEKIKDIPYTFTIKNENLSNVLSLIEKITPVKVIQHEHNIELKYNKLRDK